MTYPLLPMLLSNQNNQPNSFKHIQLPFEPTALILTDSWFVLVFDDSFQYGTKEELYSPHPLKSLNSVEAVGATHFIAHRDDLYFIQNGALIKFTLCSENRNVLQKEAVQTFAIYDDMEVIVTKESVLVTQKAVTTERKLNFLETKSEPIIGVVVFKDFIGFVLKGKKLKIIFANFEDFLNSMESEFYTVKRLDNEFDDEVKFKFVINNQQNIFFIFTDIEEHPICLYFNESDLLANYAEIAGKGIISDVKGSVDYFFVSGVDIIDFEFEGYSKSIQSEYSQILVVMNCLGTINFFCVNNSFQRSFSLKERKEALKIDFETKKLVCDEKKVFEKVEDKEDLKEEKIKEKIVQEVPVKVEGKEEKEGSSKVEEKAFISISQKVEEEEDFVKNEVKEIKLIFEKEKVEEFKPSKAEENPFAVDKIDQNVKETDSKIQKSINNFDLFEDYPKKDEDQPKQNNKDNKAKVEKKEDKSVVAKGFINLSIQRDRLQIEKRNKPLLIQTNSQFFLDGCRHNNFKNFKRIFNPIKLNIDSSQLKFEVNEVAVNDSQFKKFMSLLDKKVKVVDENTNVIYRRLKENVAALKQASEKASKVNTNLKIMEKKLADYLGSTTKFSYYLTKENLAFFADQLQNLNANKSAFQKMFAAANSKDLAEEEFEKLPKYKEMLEAEQNLILQIEMIENWLINTGSLIEAQEEIESSYKIKEMRERIGTLKFIGKKMFGKMDLGSNEKDSANAIYFDILVNFKKVIEKLLNEIMTEHSNKIHIIKSNLGKSEHFSVNFKDIFLDNKAATKPKEVPEKSMFLERMERHNKLKQKLKNWTKVSEVIYKKPAIKKYEQPNEKLLDKVKLVSIDELMARINKDSKEKSDMIKKIDEEFLAKQNKIKESKEVEKKEVDERKVFSNVAKESNGPSAILGLDKNKQPNELFSKNENKTVLKEFGKDISFEAKEKVVEPVKTEIEVKQLEGKSNLHSDLSLGAKKEEQQKEEIVPKTQANSNDIKFANNSLATNNSLFQNIGQEKKSGETRQEGQSTEVLANLSLSQNTNGTAENKPGLFPGTGKQIGILNQKTEAQVDSKSASVTQSSLIPNSLKSGQSSANTQPNALFPAQKDANTGLNQGQPNALFPGQKDANTGLNQGQPGLLFTAQKNPNTGQSQIQPNPLFPAQKDANTGLNQGQPGLSFSAQKNPNTSQNQGQPNQLFKNQENKPVGSFTGLTTNAKTFDSQSATGSIFTQQNKLETKVIAFGQANPMQPGFNNPLKPTGLATSFGQTSSLGGIVPAVGGTTNLAASKSLQMNFGNFNQSGQNGLAPQGGQSSFGNVPNNPQSGFATFANPNAGQPNTGFFKNQYNENNQQGDTFY